MIVRVLLAALLAGIAAGVVMSVIQHFRVVPYILAAETYEDARPATQTSTHQHNDGSSHVHDHGDGWLPADGFERTAFTFITNILAGVAFSLMIAAASLIIAVPVTPANGFMWGAAGFAAFVLAPAASLPPELPGMPAADLTTRQLWWWGTAMATAAGIGMLALTQRRLVQLAGLVLIALPHLGGAPHLTGHESVLPAGLVQAFVANVIASLAIFWMVLGMALGVLMRRFVHQDQTTG